MKVTIHAGAAYSNKDRNRAGDKGFHMQDKAENDRHVKQLENEYKRTHKLPRVIGNAPAARMARLANQRKQDEEAKEYAIKNEPKRFLPFLARKTNGIAGDKELRTVNGVKAAPSSSWIKSIKTTANGAPIIVEVKTKKGSKSYACPCPWQTAEQILKSPSIGADVARRLFTHTFKMGKYGTKNQGKIVHKSNGRVAKIRSL